MQKSKIVTDHCSALSYAVTFFYEVVGIIYRKEKCFSKLSKKPNADTAETLSGQPMSLNWSTFKSTQQLFCQLASAIMKKETIFRDNQNWESWLCILAPFLYVWHRISLKCPRTEVYKDVTPEQQWKDQVLVATLFKGKLRGIRHSRHSFPQGLNKHRGNIKKILQK